jgi:hypothetical protein
MILLLLLSLEGEKVAVSADWDEARVEMAPGSQGQSRERIALLLSNEEGWFMTISSSEFVRKKSPPEVSYVSYVENEHVEAFVLGLPCRTISGHFMSITFEFES